MKDKRCRAIIILTSMIISSSVLVSCGSAEAPIDQTTTQGQAETHSTIESNQVEYYEAVIKDLEDQLLGAKEESYITSTEYKLQLQALKDSIAALEKGLEHKQDVLQSNNQSNSIYNEESNRQTDHLSVKSPFVHTEQNGALTIIGHNAEGDKIVIPSSIGGVSVKAIGEAAFKQCTATRVSISDGIETIDWFAFSNSARLCEITIPSSVTSIGHGAFDGCRADLIIKCEKGSYAEAYAQSWGFIAVTQ